MSNTEGGDHVCFSKSHAGDAHIFVCACLYVHACVSVLDGDSVIVRGICFPGPLILGRWQMLSFPPSRIPLHDCVITDDLGSMGGGFITPWLNWEVRSDIYHPE